MVYFKFGKGSGKNERISWSEFSKAKMGEFPIERPHRAVQIYEHGPGVVGCFKDGCVYKKDVKIDHEKSNVARKLKPADFARIEFGKK